jgi:signal transduction histidine kinase
MTGVRVDSGETRWGQQVVLLMEQPQQALARWAEWIGKTHGARIAKGALSGWTSWYFLAFDEILWSINPKNDTLQSLSHFICRRTEEILTPANLAYQFALDESLPDRSVPPHRRHGLLLAVKEALHNILKHAGASRVELQCAMDGEVFVVRMTDNGCGFDPRGVPAAQGRHGHGLDNMRRRLAELGGECHLTSSVGGGTRIIFRLPLV